MQITGARIVNRELVLTVPMEQAQHFINDFQAGEYEIKQKRQKRSLSQNAYAWVLIDKIAEKMHIGKTVVYRGAIRDIGGVSDIVRVRAEAVDKFRDSWEHQGLGWVTEILDSTDRYADIIIYYGSSVFSKQQQSALIDSLVQEAEALDIETLTPEELARLGELPPKRGRPRKHE